MADRITSLWKRIAEMYGAKALETKFGPTPPDTWRIAVDRLKDFELERGMRRMVYGGKPHIPSLPEFLRMCREVGGDDHAAADHKPAPASRQIEAKELPRWATTANRHLLAYILDGWHKRRFYATPEMTQALVDGKNAWAEDMREHEAGPGIPADNGRALWAEYMQAAETSIAAMRHKAAA